jgi:hypothetical protein
LKFLAKLPPVFGFGDHGLLFRVLDSTAMILSSRLEERTVPGTPALSHEVENGLITKGMAGRRLSPWTIL